MIDLDISGAGVSALRAAGIGLPMVGKTVIHKASSFEPPCYVQRVTPHTKVEVGAFCSIASSIGSVSFGRYCAVGPDVTFGPNEHPTDWLTVSRLTHVQGVNGWAKFLYPDDPSAAEAKIEWFKTACPHTNIGNDVWIGQGAFIKAGVTIGDGAVVAARSVVTQDVPPYSIVAGTPAKVKRLRFHEALVERLMASQWWRYNLYDFDGLKYSDVAGSLDKIEEQAASGRVGPYEPSKVTAEDIVALVAP